MVLVIIALSSDLLWEYIHWNYYDNSWCWYLIWFLWIGLLKRRNLQVPWDVFLMLWTLWGLGHDIVLPRFVSFDPWINSGTWTNVSLDETATSGLERAVSTTWESLFWVIYVLLLKFKLKKSSSLKLFLLTEPSSKSKKP